jgi:CrcB protein
LPVAGAVIEFLRMATTWLRAGLVLLGGGIGAVARYTLTGWVARQVQPSVFPWGTLVINVSGALVIGLIMGGSGGGRWLLTPDARVFLTAGLLGGYTTFSTFAYETVEALRVGDVRVAVGNVAASVFVGLAACWLGLRIGERL